MNKDNEPLLEQIEATVNGLITKRQLKWMSNTVEFREGMLIGLELAGIYGRQISEMYTAEEDMRISGATSDDNIMHDTPPNETSSNSS